MQTGEAIWNMAAILHYLERRHSTDAQMLRLLGLGQESCKAISNWAAIELPNSDKLQTYVTFFDNKFFPNMKPVSPPKGADEPKRAARNPKEAEEALSLCKTILSGCNALEGRRNAEEFVESVSTKAESMRDWVEDKGFVTEKQLNALRNMKEAVDKWLARGKMNHSRGEPEEDYTEEDE